MDFSKIKKTCVRLSDDVYRIKVGQDFIEVSTNFGWMRYPSTLDIQLIRHYIGNPSKLPSNPNRTDELLREVRNYFSKKYMREMEKDIKSLASLPASDKLQKDFNGKRFEFKKGNSARDILNEVTMAYMAYSSYFAITSKHIFDILMDLSENDGFLHEAIDEDLSWVDCF